MSAKGGDEYEWLCNLLSYYQRVIDSTPRDLHGHLQTLGQVIIARAIDIKDRPSSSALPELPSAPGGSSTCG